MDPMNNADANSRSRDRDQIGPLLAALSGADQDAGARARALLVSLAVGRMQALAHRMLAGSAQVRRWEETDDIVQGALLRLHRALGAVTPNDTQHFLRLAALQVRRELIDLTRRHGHAESMAANHDTNASPFGGGQRVEAAIAQEAGADDRLAEWTRFHDVVETLSDEQRELFGMVWYLGMSQDEIAAALDCSTRTVRRRWEETKRRFTHAFTGGLPE